MKRLIALSLGLVVLLATPASAATVEVTDTPTTPVQLLLLFFVLAILPGLVFAVTAFPRILIVLSFLRQAMGTPSTPPNQLLVGIALFLTLFVMAPTINLVKDVAVQPYMDKKISFNQALTRGQLPLRNFMFANTRPSDVALFVKLSKPKTIPKTRSQVPTLVLIPAFITSELKTAFQIGFLLFLPFLIIDLVVASTLLSVGMMMLPPPLISLPFKLLLFVLVDGWALLFQSLVNSFNTS
jgi:flagellar biosynthetic protein FliP